MEPKKDEKYMSNYGPCLNCSAHYPERKQKKSTKEYCPFCSKSCAAIYAINYFESMEWCEYCKSWDETPHYCKEKT